MQTFRSRIYRAASRTEGFTRVELLVVLAMFCAFLLLVVPGIQNAREAARRRQCHNNLQSIGLALTMEKFDKIKNDSLGNFTGMYPGTVSDDHTDSKILLAITTAILAALGAMLGSLFIKFVVRFFNRRADRLGKGMHAEELHSSALDSWFCPPSSSPI